MPPSLMVRQRQPPISSPPEAGWASGPCADSIPGASPEPPPAWASARPFSLASPRRARRCWSNCEATSCQPAEAAVADTAQSAVASETAKRFLLECTIFKPVITPERKMGRPHEAGDDGLCVWAGKASDGFADIRFGPLARVGVGRRPAGERGRRRDADDVVAGVDVMDLARHADRQIAEQIGGGAADLVERDVRA